MNLSEKDEIPGEGDKILSEGDKTPGEGDKTLREGDKTLSEGDEAPGEGDKNLSEGDENRSEGDKAFSGEDEKMRRRNFNMAVQRTIYVKSPAIPACGYFLLPTHGGYDKFPTCTVLPLIACLCTHLILSNAYHCKNLSRTPAPSDFSTLLSYPNLK
jgi:hypothetical protein